MWMFIPFGFLATLILMAIIWLLGGWDDRKT